MVHPMYYNIYHVPNYMKMEKSSNGLIMFNLKYLRDAQHMSHMISMARREETFSLYQMVLLAYCKKCGSVNLIYLMRFCLSMNCPYTKTHLPLATKRRLGKHYKRLEGISLYNPFKMKCDHQDNNLLEFISCKIAQIT